jgi:hypothetical protein
MKGWKKNDNSPQSNKLQPRKRMEILLAKILFDVLRLPNEDAQNRTRKRRQKLANLKAENTLENLRKINK